MGTVLLYLSAYLFTGGLVWAIGFYIYNIFCSDKPVTFKDIFKEVDDVIMPVFIFCVILWPIGVLICSGIAFVSYVEDKNPKLFDPDWGWVKVIRRKNNENTDRICK